MRLDLLAALNAARAGRRAALVVTELPSGAQRFVPAEDVDADPLAGQLAERLRVGRGAVVEHEGGSSFVAVHLPPARLIVVGAVHVAQALGDMARLVEVDVTVVDPRTAFASPERFPDVPVIAAWPDEALPPLGLDRFTALAALTHDPRIDDPALTLALRSGCFYVGALGSRKTHAGRCERLRAAGFGPDDLARIHAPIGLDIGAVTPAEIAVSILGEVIGARRRKPTRAERPTAERPTAGERP